MIPAKRLKPLKELRRAVVFKLYGDKWTLVAASENFERARELEAEGCEVFVCDNTRNIDTLVDQFVKLYPLPDDHVSGYLHKFLEFICF